jgi:hypothetical protein
MATCPGWPTFIENYLSTRISPMFNASHPSYELWGLKHNTILIRRCGSPDHLLPRRKMRTRSTKKAHETYTRNTIVIEFDPSRTSIPQLHNLNYAIARIDIALCKKRTSHLKSVLIIISAVILHRRGAYDLSPSRSSDDLTTLRLRLDLGI